MSLSQKSPTTGVPTNGPSWMPLKAYEAAWLISKEANSEQ